MSEEVAEYIASLIDVRQVVPPLHGQGLLLVSYARANYLQEEDRKRIAAQLHSLFDVPVLLTEDVVDMRLLTDEDLASVGLMRAPE